MKQQTYTNWELCIADDCSTDKSVPEYLKTVESNQILVAYQDKNGGISEATNAAAKLATGDYILLMDNDDEITFEISEIKGDAEAEQQKVQKKRH